MYGKSSLCLPQWNLAFEFLRKRVSFSMTGLPLFLEFVSSTLEGIENKQRLQTLSIDNAWSNKNFLFYLTFRMLQHTGLIVGTAILSTSVKRNDDYMIGRLNILRLSQLLGAWITLSTRWIAIQQISVKNLAIHWIMIYPVDIVLSTFRTTRPSALTTIPPSSYTWIGEVSKLRILVLKSLLFRFWQMSWRFSLRGWNKTFPTLHRQELWFQGPTLRWLERSMNQSWPSSHLGSLLHLPLSPSL